MPKKKTTARPKQQTYTLHVISDATGLLASRLINTILTQFPDITFKQVYHTFRDTRSKIDHTIASIGKRRQLVLHALVDPDNKATVAAACDQLKIPHYDMTGHLVQFIADHIGIAPANELSRLHQVNAGYYQRVAAMEFTAAHDDGQGLGTLHQADVVLVGLSRVSKSPTSTYLGSLGLKTANVSITLTMGLPKQLTRVKSKVVALTIQPKRLTQIRKGRSDELGTDDTGDYADLKQVIREVIWAEQQYQQRGYPIIDTTDMTVEKTAASVLRLKKIRLENIVYRTD